MTGRAISHFLKAATSTFAEVIVIDNGSKELFTLCLLSLFWSI
jgi:glycosyltransferase involved in cell wall biosynthesis